MTVRSAPRAMSPRATLPLLVLALVAAAAPSASRPLPVAVSLPPQVWLLERLGGERIEVFSILEPSDSPATYQPTDREVTRVLGARLFVRQGVPFEDGAWLAALAAARNLEIVHPHRGLELRRLEEHHHGEAAPGRRSAAGPARPHDHSHHDPAGGHDGGDPHTWLSPRMLAAQAETVADALVRLDPEGEGHYRERLGRLRDELRALDAELERLLAPVKGASFVVFHPSWGYLADAYGLRQVAVERGGKAPGEAEVTELARQVRSLGVRGIVVQPQIRGAEAEALATAAGVPLVTLDPLARDVPANLRHAARTIREIAGTAAPTGGGPR